MFRPTRLMNTVKNDIQNETKCLQPLNQINNPTDDNTILVSRITLGQALLEALNPVQVRLTWTLMLSSIDALSDQTAIAFRDRLFALLSDSFPVRLLGELTTLNLTTTDALLADQDQFVETTLANPPDSPDSNLLIRIVTLRQALKLTLQSKNERDWEALSFLHLKTPIEPNMHIALSTTQIPPATSMPQEIIAIC